MATVQAHWKGGQVVVEEPVDWPDGCSLEIRPMTGRASAGDLVESNDPETIALWITEFQATPPLEMTESEQAEWQAARQAQREFELKTFDQRADKIQKALP